MRAALPVLVATLLSQLFSAPALGSGNDDLARESAALFRGVLASPGGPLPFGLEIRGASGDRHAFILNAEERIPVESVSWTDDELVLRFDHYASIVKARRAKDEEVYRGVWTKRSPGKDSKLAATFERIVPSGVPPRFPDRRIAPGSDSRRDAPPPPISGEWKVRFHGSEGKLGRAVARFETPGGDRVTGTFLTPTGDYRYLEGDYREGRLRLSCFDGAHAFLFHATLEPGEKLQGDFWSRDSWHEEWTATRFAGGESSGAYLPDPFSMTSLVEGQTLEFTFPDLEGRPVSLADDAFRGKPVIVEIFGSWCPNCHDAAPVLRDLRERYRDTGIRILGLAYEITGDAARDAEQVRRFAERYGCDWTLLLAGTSSKAKASRTLPALTGIKSYPTTIFIDRKGRVRRIYTGFSGPATGSNHRKLLEEWDAAAREIVQ